MMKIIKKKKNRYTSDLLLSHQNFEWDKKGNKHMETETCIDQDINIE